MNPRALGVAVVVVAVVGVVGAAWLFRGPSGPPKSAEFTVEVAASALRLDGDPEGTVRVYAPADEVRWVARRCGERAQPAALWVASGADGAWRRVEIPAWADREGCVEARVSARASDLWPDVAPGVGRWAWAVGPDAEQIVDPADAERAWRAGSGFARGEVVLRAAP